MKKLFLGGVLTLLFSFSYAQIGDFLQDTRFGVKAGVNYSRVGEIHKNSESRIGFNAGVLAVVPVSYEDKYFIQPEVSYSQKGEKNKAVDTTEAYNMDYVDLSVLFKAYLFDDESGFFGILGPQFSFLVKDDVKNRSNDLKDQFIKSYRDDKYNSFDLGIVGGVGYSYKRNIEITLRGEYGFLDTVDGNSKESIVKNKTGVISLGLSYIF